MDQVLHKKKGLGHDLQIVWASTWPELPRCRIGWVEQSFREREVL